MPSLHFCRGRAWMIITTLYVCACAAGGDGDDDEPSECAPNCERCGNGIVGTGEECDDGNAANDDGCSTTCFVERCGDGIVQNARNERCDDDNIDSNDGCSASCQVERCGDAILQPNEACDDGNNAQNDGCSAVCVIELCGDGVVQSALGELCDDGSPACQACQLDEVCLDERLCFRVIAFPLTFGEGFSPTSVALLANPFPQGNSTGFDTIALADDAAELVQMYVFVSGELSRSVDFAEAFDTTLTRAAGADLVGEGRDTLLLAASNGTAGPFPRHGEGNPFTYQALLQFAGNVTDLGASDLGPGVLGDARLELFAGSDAGEVATLIEDSSTPQQTIAVMSESAITRLLAVPLRDGGGILAASADRVFGIDVVTEAEGVHSLIVDGATSIGAPILDIATGDFDPNDDGALDVVALVDGELLHATWHGPGFNIDGSFQAWQSDPSATALAAADLDGDGRTDIVVTRGSDSITVLLAGGAATASLPALGKTTRAALRDYDSDGDVDILVGGTSQGAGASLIFQSLLAQP